LPDTLTEHISHLALGEKEQDEQATELDPIQHDMSAEDEPTQEVGEDTADEGTQPAEQQEEAVDWQARYEEIQRESAGRLGEIGSLREQLRNTGDNIEALRKMVMEQTATVAEQEKLKKLELQQQKEIEQYGEQVVNDPHVSYMRDKLRAIEQQNEREAQLREGRMRQVAEEQQRRQQFEQQRQQFLTTLKTQEDSFREVTPDYDDAYEFARGKRKEMYVRRGHDAASAERIVSEEEAFLAQEQLVRGGNVAQEIYNWARDYGWSPVPGDEGDGTAAGQPNAQEAQIPSQEVGTGPGDFERIKRGIASAGLRQMDSQAARANDEYVGIEQFYKTVPDHIRAQVHADPQLFEELGRTGKIKKFW